MNRNQLVSTLLVMATLGSGAATLGDGRIENRATLDSILGENQRLEEFERFRIAEGEYARLDVSELDNRTIANGQGPGLVERGATYRALSNHLAWQGNAYFGLQSKTLIAGGDGLEISYEPYVTAMGLDARAYAGYGYEGRITVYDLNDTIVGQFEFTLSFGGGENVFVGWEWTPGISRVVLHNLTYPGSPIVDNHAYGPQNIGYECALLGTCPGRITLSWRGANPNQRQGVLFAADLGQFLIPGGVCRGTPLGLSSYRFRALRFIGTRTNGSGSVRGTAQSGACGGYIQLVEKPSCITSNVAGPI